MENWKDIPGYEGRYEVSDLGRVRNAVTGRLRKLHKNRNGYFCLGLTVRPGRGQKIKTYSVHRLVAMAFLGVTLSEETVTHLDFNKDNNALSNLETQSRKKIMKRAVDCEVVPPPPPAKGMGHPNSKLTDADVLEIRNISKNRRVTHEEIARKISISRSVVTDIINGKIWRHI